MSGSVGFKKKVFLTEVKVLSCNYHERKQNNDDDDVKEGLDIEPEAKIQHICMYKCRYIPMIFYTYKKFWFLFLVSLAHTEYFECREFIVTLYNSLWY